jgi:protein-L-isoaspartate(D-aspartate) O-methyltransferase
MPSLARKRLLGVLILVLALPILVLTLERSWHHSFQHNPVQIQTDVSDSKHDLPEEGATRSLKPEPALKSGQGEAAPTPEPGPADPLEKEAARERLTMVKEQLARRDITDERVLSAMRRVRRHLFVPEELRELAYTDGALPIGHRQTISQPYIVALMTQLGRPDRRARVLDVGTGSGYQAAVLAELVEHVHSIEILCPLADAARERLQSLGYNNVEVRCGDGYGGWPEYAPFDVILVAAAPEQIPQPLLDQLAPGGRLVIPVGKSYQELVVVEKKADGGTTRRSVAPVVFVPMTRDTKAAGKAR